MQRSWIKGAFILAATNAVIFLLLFAAGEFVVRWRTEGGVAAAVYSLVRHRTPESRLGRSNKWLVPDSEIGYRLNPQNEAVNSLGIRHAEISSTKPEGSVRIIVLGDSVAFPWGPEGFVSILREQLRRRVQGVDVINASVPGYTTFQERRFLEHDLLALKPDLVILQYCLNDNHRFLHILNSTGNLLVTPEVAHALMPDGSGWLSQLARSSYLLFEIRSRVLSLHLRSASHFPWEDRIDLATAWQNTSWADFEEHLRAMHDALTGVGARFAVLAVPLEMQLRQDLLDLDRAYTLKPQRHLSEICLAAGVPLLDLFPDFFDNRVSKLYGDGLHLSSAGHELVGRSLLRFLEAENLVPGLRTSSGSEKGTAERSAPAG